MAPAYAIIFMAALFEKNLESLVKNLGCDGGRNIHDISMICYHREHNLKKSVCEKTNFTKFNPTIEIACDDYSRKRVCSCKSCVRRKGNIS